jgi:hypothetical protein
VYRWDGALLHNVALSNPSEEDRADYARLFPMALGPESPLARVVRGRRDMLHLADALTDPEMPEFVRQIARRRGYRAQLMVPMLREGSAIGIIGVSRAEPGFFTDSQVKLVQTFADQAVIAIENVRLFKELEARNRDLTEALEQRTATSEILRVISQSPTDVQPVFDTIASAAMKLCGGSYVTVVRYDGRLVDIAALATTWKREEADAIRRLYPQPPSPDTVASRAVLTRSVVNIIDVQQDSEYAMRDVAR